MPYSCFLIVREASIGLDGPFDHLRQTRDQTYLNHGLYPIVNPLRNTVTLKLDDLPLIALHQRPQIVANLRRMVEMQGHHRSLKGLSDGRTARSYGFDSGWDRADAQAREEG